MFGFARLPVVSERMHEDWRFRGVEVGLKLWHVRRHRRGYWMANMGMSDLHLEQLTDNTPVVEVISFKIFYCRVAQQVR